MLLTPDLRVDAAYDVRPEWLIDRGIEGVLVDMDDTLLPAHTSHLNARYRLWLDTLLAHGLGTVVLSNGDRRRTMALAATLGIPALALVGKPLRIAFRRGLERLGTAAASTAMIGDQLFTDVLGANLAGITSILVTPLSAGGLPHTRLARRLERRILARSQPDRGSRGRSIHR